MNKIIVFSQALTGYFLDAHARHLSQHTLADYQNTFKLFQEYLQDDPEVSQISIEQISGFLASRLVSNKTILNYHTGLSAFYTWAIRAGLVTENLLHQIPRPKPEKRVIDELTLDQIKAMLGALKQTKVYTRPGKRPSSHSIQHADRNKAIILLLLDTGIRVSELCTLQIFNCDLKQQRIMVMGKGAKERFIPISARTGQVLWKYLSKSRKEARLNDYLFVTKNNLPMTRKNTLDTLADIGTRAGVHNVHPHRFRHTFAINYLRNGGDVFTLQSMLGHSTLDMVSHYLKIAKTDLTNGHLKASPVDNWRL
jgi:site-specific recombinase XerD